MTEANQETKKKKDNESDAVAREAGELVTAIVHRVSWGQLIKVVLVAAGVSVGGTIGVESLPGRRAATGAELKQNFAQSASDRADLRTTMHKQDEAFRRFSSESATDRQNLHREFAQHEDAQAKQIEGITSTIKALGEKIDGRFDRLTERIDRIKDEGRRSDASSLGIESPVTQAGGT